MAATCSSSLPARTMRLRGGRSPAIATLLLTAGCGVSENVLGPEVCPRPAVSSSSVSAVSGNVLAALVTASVNGADSAAVRFGPVGAMLGSSTPTAPAADPVTIPIFGLQAANDYRMQVVAFNDCGSAAGEYLSFSTGQLPDDLPAYVAGGNDPASGYVVFAAGDYGLVIDNTGRVVWYHHFPGGAGLSFQPQPNGRYTARPPPAAGAPAAWVEVDPLGSLTRKLGCARGLPARLHDLLTEPDGSFWVLCDEIRTVDLSSQGRSPEERVVGTAVQHIGAAGELLFEWTTFDNFEIDLRDLDEADMSGPAINWTHGNALDLDADGNLLISFRNLNEITKVDTRTGAVIWRMGGSRNQFTFEDVAAVPFVRQHSVRAVSPGQLLLLDNLGEPGRSRAELYQYDKGRRTVRLVVAHASSTGVIAGLGGSTQMLSAGHMLVSFGNGGSVEEYDAVGDLVWRIVGYPGYVFRAQRIRSLYQPGAGDPR